jgi:hypothetical protein
MAHVRICGGRGRAISLVYPTKVIALPCLASLREEWLLTDFGPPEAGKLRPTRVNLEPKSVTSTHAAVSVEACGGLKAAKEHIQALRGLDLR